MGFFDFLDDEAQGLTTSLPPGQMGVSMSQTGSMLPTAQGKRGKKTRIAMHRIKPLTALDKGKLESLGKAGDPTLEQLEQWGIKYEISPETGTQGNKGMGNPQEPMLQDKRDPNKTIQGDLGDVPRMLSAGAKALPGAAKAVGNAAFNVVSPDWKGNPANDKAKERLRLEAQDKQTRLDVKAAQQQGDQPLDLPTVHDAREDTIIGAAESQGVPEKDFYRGIAEIGKKLGLDLDQRVQFPLAIERLLNSSEFAELRPDYEMLGSAAAGSEGVSAPKTGELALKDQGAGKGGDEKQPEKRNLYAEEVGLLTKLAQARDISTWGEAIAFVILSMLIKPQMAILFFSKAAERGTLKAQLHGISREIKRMEQDELRKASLYEWNRRKAIEIKMQGAEEGWRRERAKTEFYRNWLLLQEKAALHKKQPTNDPVIRNLQSDLDNSIKFAASASRAASAAAAAMDTKTAADHQADYDDWMEKAQKQLKLLEAYKKRTGAVPMEEPATEEAEE